MSNEQPIVEERPERKALPLEVVKSYRARLGKFAPKVFGKGVFVPLKIGIDSDISRASPIFCNPRLLTAVFRNHTSKKAYLAANSVAGAIRYDLNGEPAGTVSEAAAIHAANRLAKIKRREAAFKKSTSPTTLAIVPSRIDGDEHVKIPISQSDQCNAIAASLGLEAQSPRREDSSRKAPIIVIKKSRRVSA